MAFLFVGSRAGIGLFLAWLPANVVLLIATAMLGGREIVIGMMRRADR